MNKPVVFVVGLDDLSKLVGTEPISVVTSLKNYYDTNCSEDTTEILVDSQIILRTAKPVCPPENAKLIFATKGKHLNSDNRKLIQVKIA